MEDTGLHRSEHDAGRWPQLKGRAAEALVRNEPSCGTDGVAGVFRWGLSGPCCAQQEAG